MAETYKIFHNESVVTRPALFDWQARTFWTKNITTETTAETKTPVSLMLLRYAKTFQKIISKW